MKYKAWIIREDNGCYTRAIEEQSTDDLPQGDVLLRVHYAGLNYKDGLSSAGHKGITRKFPHQPGIDAAGVVVSDSSSTFAEGDKVICTSFDLGMNTAGGFGEYIRVPAGWCVPLPSGLTLEESMIHGSGGYTAALALYKMEQNGQKPEMGPICVTGATGGVGSLAVAVLAQAGYEVIASTGKPEEHTFLQSLGATEIIDRNEVNDESGKPLLRSKWAGAIDNVGGNTLATLLKCCGRNGSVACIGLVASDDLQTTVFPFILNGVNLLGIESAYTPVEVRTEIWRRLANQWRVSQLHDIKTVISLEQLDPYFDLILEGKTRGRIVVRYESK